MTMLACWLHAGKLVADAATAKPAPLSLDARCNNFGRQTDGQASKQGGQRPEGRQLWTGTKLPQSLPTGANRTRTRSSSTVSQSEALSLSKRSEPVQSSPVQFGTEHSTARRCAACSVLQHNQIQSTCLRRQGLSHEPAAASIRSPRSTCQLGACQCARSLCGEALPSSPPSRATLEAGARCHPMQHGSLAARSTEHGARSMKWNMKYAGRSTAPEECRTRGHDAGQGTSHERT